MFLKISIEFSIPFRIQHQTSSTQEIKMFFPECNKNVFFTIFNLKGGTRTQIGVCSGRGNK